MLDSAYLNEQGKDPNLLRNGLWPLSDAEEHFIKGYSSNNSAVKRVEAIDQQWLLASLDRIARDLSRASDQIVDPAAFSIRVEELDRYFQLVTSNSNANPAQQPPLPQGMAGQQILWLQQTALGDQIKTLRSRAEDYLRRAGSGDKRIGMVGMWSDRSTSSAPPPENSLSPLIRSLERSLDALEQRMKKHFDKRGDGDLGLSGSRPPLASPQSQGPSGLGSNVASKDPGFDNFFVYSDRDCQKPDGTRDYFVEGKGFIAERTMEMVNGDFPVLLLGLLGRMRRLRMTCEACRRRSWSTTTR